MNIRQFDISDLKKLYLPSPESHKGQNGKLLIIGGSKLFHAASLWALSISSKIVDMVFYASVAENNAIVHEAKSEFRNGIVIPRTDIERYLGEADAVLIGPGLLRAEKEISQSLATNFQLPDIINIKDEGEQSYWLTKYLLEKYPGKKWIIDAGALQMMKSDWLSNLKEPAIITPHVGEFERLFSQKPSLEIVPAMAKKYHCIILLKGREDPICSPERCIEVKGGNAGMTKGGTGDVLAGLVAALACKNEPWLAAECGSCLNKAAGDDLYQRVGYFFNASDLVEQIPLTMKRMPL